MIKSIRTEIIIDAPKETVWGVLTDFTNYPAWNPFIVNIEGELITGSKLTNTMLNGDKRFVFRPKVLKVIPYRYFDWAGSLWVKGIFDGHHYFEIEELTPAQVKLSHGEYFSGIFSTYILKKIGDDTLDNFIKMNQAIKKLAESIQIII